MLHSVRARLALWHTVVLAIFLTGFALAAYIFLRTTTARGAEEYLASVANSFALEVQSERQDATSDSAAIAAAVAEFHVRDLGVTVFDSRGKRLAVSSGGALLNATQAHSGVSRPDSMDAPLSTTRLRDVTLHMHGIRSAMLVLPDEEGGYRVALMSVPLRAGVYRIAMVQSRHGEQETLEDARTASMIAIPLLLIAAGMGGSFLAKRSLAPVTAMSEQAARISETNLDERLVVANPRDELGKLAAVLNDLLARVDSSLKQQRQFMADASHELRTPVSIMRAEAEVSLAADARAAAEYRESLGVIADTSARLSTIVNELFLLARADSGQQPLTRTALYLDELVTECARAVRSLALRSGITLALHADADAPFVGDDELLRRLVTNLLDNAIKYSGRGATVTVTLEQTADCYTISIRDTGAGIAAAALPHLFERFFRADPARSRAASRDGSSGGGAGLGLAIARWVARAHGGEVRVASSGAEGTEFVVSLPKVEPSMLSR